MKGIVVKKAKVVNEDERRKLIEIQNGQVDVKNLKILEVKEDSYLGGHWHMYPEVMYVLSGKVWDYKMKNMDTGEEETFKLEAGDIVFRTARIMHGGWFGKGTKIIDGGGETYISADFNDIQEDIW
jgi:hypothetical protein